MSLAHEHLADLTHRPVYGDVWIRLDRADQALARITEAGWVILGMEGSEEHPDGKHTPHIDLIWDFCDKDEIPSASDSHRFAREALDAYADDPRAERIMVSFTLREAE